MNYSLHSLVLEDVEREEDAGPGGQPGLARASLRARHGGAYVRVLSRAEVENGTAGNFFRAAVA